MRREAVRTLYALTTKYQRDIDESDYEVLVLDSNSTEPLDQGFVKSLQSNFRYHYVQSESPTPNRAMNFGIKTANADLVCCMIDGARIPTPNMLSRMMRASAAYPSAYIFTLGMHLGPSSQDVSVCEGYCQSIEDELLNKVAWEEDGYELFRISSLAVSSRDGYFGQIAESNCFAVPRDTIMNIGGFDERFESPGGGLINLHLHNQLISNPSLRPVMLLGEATFHQFHGGVATNTPSNQSPFGKFCEEYERILGLPFSKEWRAPIYFGTLPQQSLPFVIPERFNQSSSNT